MSITAKLRHRLRSNYRKQFISPMPVPFVLPRYVIPDGRTVLCETWQNSARISFIASSLLLACATLGGVALLAGLVHRADGAIFWKCVVLIALGGTLGLLSLGFGIVNSAATQQLQPDSAGLRIELVDANDRNDEVVCTSSTSNCALTIRAVNINQKPAGSWAGYALILSLGDNHSIALACLESRERIDAWLQTAPSWIRKLPVANGDNWKRLGHLKGFPKTL